MNRIIALSAFALAFAVEAACAFGTEPTAEQIDFFEVRIRPLLAAKCYDCHGSETQESGLRLDSRQAIIDGGDSGLKAVVPGDPDKSLLVAAIRHEGDFQMPPDDKLAAEEIEAVAAWIKLGLPWPQDVAAPAMSEAERREHARQTHWAFQPVSRPAIPAVSDANWISTPLDRYVLHKLESSGLAPSPMADRVTWIRRLTFDLIGLPPTPDEVAAFVADDAPDAHQRVVDRLLASPQYGERWGRHWLDVARYADTRGYAFNRERRYPYAYTYRDYVIDSLNADLPYDQFIVEQVAADLLPQPENSRALAALGFLTVGRKFNNRHDDLDDQIDVVTRGLMGLTVTCARCHDHKYDPIPTADYYSLYGVFASSTEPDDLPLLGDPADAPGYAEFKNRLDELSAERDAFLAKEHAEILDTARSRVTEYLVRVVARQPEELLQKLPFISLSRDELRPKLVERWRTHLRDHGQVDHPVFGLWHELMSRSDESFSSDAAAIVDRWRAVEAGVDAGQLNSLIKAAIASGNFESKIDLAKLYGDVIAKAYSEWKATGLNRDSLASLPDETRQLIEILAGDGSPTDIPIDHIRDHLNRAERNKLTELQKRVDSHEVNHSGSPPRAMIVQENAPHNPHVFIRGNHARRGESVPRQSPYAVAGPDRQPFQHGSGRLELARTIASADNPLTARVIVNRVWMQHFGEPLVDTPSDFGTRSEQPVHQQLLDYLAWRLVDRDWSLKSLHREMVLSSTYRQSSNFRSDAEAVDPENRLLWRMNRRRLEFETLRDALLAAAGTLDLQMHGKPEEIVGTACKRRSVYAFIDRQDLPNLFRVFDFASPDQSAARRPNTTVPQQSLFMMNSPFVADAARAVSARHEIATAPNDDAKINAIYQRLFSRTPTSPELQIGQQFIATARENHDSADQLDPWQQYIQLLLLSNEFVHVD